ncbi:MAG TPA: hypothetical protein DD473_14890 [Planctomycetaceae bacterium]|nr:hypothetical protein [Planctomycetaceae bacterium]|tara:strand:+ start:1184 stop:1363 length:180 start_codon:yes stop_codon:yes gene_type:complete
MHDLGIMISAIAFAQLQYVPRVKACQCIFNSVFLTDRFFSEKILDQVFSKTLCLEAQKP